MNMTSSNPLSQSKLTILTQPSENTQNSKLFPKICWLQSIVSKLQTQLNHLVSERQVLYPLTQSVRQDKQQVKEVLLKKNQEAKQTLMKTLKDMEKELMNGYEKGLEETKGVQSKVNRLKEIQIMSQKQLLGIQRRVTEIETQIGI